jgi:hypothetical protein
VGAGGDDVSVPERVSMCMELAEAHGIQGCVSARFQGFQGRLADVPPLQLMHGKVKILAPADTAWLKWSRPGKVPGMPGAALMYNRKLFELFSPIPPGVMAEDAVMRCRALMSGLGVAWTSAGLVHYRIHDANVSSGVGKDVYEQRVLFSKAVVYRDFLEFRRKFPELYPDEVWERMSRYFKTYLFRSIVIARQNEVGRVRSFLLRLIGLRRLR